MENDIEKEILIKHVSTTYDNKIQLYKKSHFDQKKYNLDEIKLFTIAAMDDLLLFLYDYEYSQDISMIEKKEEVLDLMLKIEVLFVKYLIASDQNYVMPLIRSKEYAVKAILMQKKSTLYNLSALHIISDLKSVFVKVLDRNENSEEIYIKYIGYLSMSYVFISLLSFNYKFDNLFKTTLMDIMEDEDDD